MRGSLFNPVGRYLALVLAPYYKEASSHVSNSLGVKRRLSSAFESFPQAIMGSYDVISLFTRVPIHEAMEVVAHFLRNDPDLESRTRIDIKTLCDLIEFCLTSCYFLFRSTFYVQHDGVAMGSNIGCVIANIYMRFFEEMALARAPQLDLPLPLLWLRYVDDVIALFHNESHFIEFLSLLNSLRSSIQFTHETESDGQLPFLDLLIKKTENGVVFGVYRKPTHTDLYVKRDSCHPTGVFKGLVIGLKKRALSLCSAQELPTELGHIRKVLKENGYKNKDVHLLSSRVEKVPTSLQKELAFHTFPVFLKEFPGVLKNRD